MPNICLQVCNGYANQRLAIAYGILLANSLGRTAVLPDLLKKGTQLTDARKSVGKGNRISMSHVYDVSYFEQKLAEVSVKIMLPEIAPSRETYVIKSIQNEPDSMMKLRVYSIFPHLLVDCTFLTLRPDFVEENKDLLWQIFAALRPAPEFQKLISTGIQSLQNAAPGSGYNFLHVRLENDWVSHCERWSNIPDGVVRDNCFNNTFDLSSQLHRKGVSNDTVLYVAASWKESSMRNVNRVLPRLALAGYKVMTQRKLFGGRLFFREEAAHIDYYIAMESDRFVGNSVSSFSALVIMERRKLERWASYYNGGNIPLSGAIPLYPLPWVFTYNDWSEPYDYMLKGAVRSATAVGMLKRFCLFSGSKTSPIYKWLEENEVTLLVRPPKWKNKFLSMVSKDNVEHSHLYKNPEMAVGTWQRIDIPILPELEQYEYILFTDADVYFRKPVTLESFPLPLPKTISMAAEMDDIFPYNAGVMLMHLPELRATYDDFLEFIWSNTNGLYFPGYGPGDQGAYNQFYESTVVGSKLSQDFNAKPYAGELETSFLVHFHGPKPYDLLMYLETGDCKFGSLCEQGSKRSYCFYILEWYDYVKDILIAQKLYTACKVMYRTGFLTAVKSQAAV